MNGPLEVLLPARSRAVPRGGAGKPGREAPEEEGFHGALSYLGWEPRSRGSGRRPVCEGGRGLVAGRCDPLWLPPATRLHCCWTDEWIQHRGPPEGTPASPAASGLPQASCPPPAASPCLGLAGKGHGVFPGVLLCPGQLAPSPAPSKRPPARFRGPGGPERGTLPEMWLGVTVSKGGGRGAAALPPAPARAAGKEEPVG